MNSEPSTPTPSAAEDAAAAPERYADTYTGQSLARLVEEIEASKPAPAPPAPEPAPREEPHLALDDTLFRVHSIDDDTVLPAAPADVASAATERDEAGAPVDALALALSDFERRLRAHVEAVRREERLRYERRFAERVNRMRKRAEELLREKLLQARARDRERLAAHEQQLNDMHARLTALVNKLTHQKARIQDARRQLADKLAIVASLHSELNSLGQNVTRELDDLDGIFPDQPPKAE